MSFHGGLVHLLFWHVLAFNHLSRHANPTTTDKTYIKRKRLLVLYGTHCIGKWNERLGFRPLVNLNWARQTLRQWNECVKHACLRLELHWTPNLVAGSPKRFQGEWPLYWEVRHIHVSLTTLQNHLDSTPIWPSPLTGASRYINTLRPRRNGQHFTDNIFKRIFFNENV